MDSFGVQLVVIIGGVVTAAVTIAAQNVVTALAGYLTIRRNRVFEIGDRIKMGGTRGDVIAIGWMQTRLLEMGQPHDVNEQEGPGMWVRSRQFSGRVVTITNDKIFSEPVYNLTREFPYIWEEMHIPIRFKADLAHAEHILLDAAIEATREHCDRARDAVRAFNEKYRAQMDQPDPRVYWRLTDNWLEMTIRFIVPERGMREIKDRMTRQILRQLADANIDVASATFEITGVPPLQLQRAPAGRPA